MQSWNDVCGPCLNFIKKAECVLEEPAGFREVATTYVGGVHNGGARKI
jgi:hypothetical protein